MIRWIKQRFCRHVYHSVHEREEDVDYGVGYNLQKLHILYCPKCRKEIEVRKWQYQAILEKQRLDELQDELRRKEDN